MAKTFALSKTQILVAVCLAHDGYRRAGLGFSKGDNTLDAAALSEAQLATLDEDPRIRLEIRDQPRNGAAVPESALVSTPGSLDPEDRSSSLAAASLTASSSTAAPTTKGRSKAKTATGSTNGAVV